MKLINSTDGPFSPEFNNALHSPYQVVLIRNGVNIPITGMMSSGTVRTVIDATGSYIVMTPQDGLGVLE
jgi:hypothetical protein